MLKRVLLFLSCFILIMPLSALAEIPPRPTTAGFIFDYQNVIDDEIEKEMNDFAFKMQERGIMELFVLTVPTIGDLEPFEYGIELFRQWGIGDLEKDNGLVIFATTDMGEGNNKVRIATGYGLEGDYPDGRTGELLDEYMVPYLNDGDYTTAFAKVIEAIRVQEDVDHAWQQEAVFVPEPSTIWDTIFFLIFAGIFLVIGLIALFIILLIIYAILRFIQKLFFNSVEKVTGKDFRSARYKAYLKRKEEEAEAEAEAEAARLAAAAVAGTSANTTDSYDYNSYDSGSSDSYSGGGGDSGGGGSDRSF